MSIDSLNNIQILEQQFSELMSMINYHRSRASRAVNEQQLLLAWNVGAYVSTKLKTEQWGSKVVTQFSEYIKTKAPDIKGFSRRNIYNMVMLYEEYSSHIFLEKASSLLPKYFVQTKTTQLQTTDSQKETQPLEIVQTVSAQIPWSHNVAILDKVKDPDQRIWYIQKTAENGWSHNVLIHQIESGLYER